jgi:hypothetical protein
MDIKTLDTHKESMREALKNGVYYRITEKGILKYSCPRHCKFETVNLRQIRSHVFNTHPIVEP